MEPNGEEKMWKILPQLVHIDTRFSGNSNRNKISTCFGMGNPFLRYAARQE
jgi:hypothetical protein